MGKRLVTVLAACGLLSTLVPGQETAAPRKRPKVVLVLSGGGARGTAHIGVIKKLEEYHVPVDLVVGTSMGSIIGGLYSSGWSVEEMEKRISGIDWGGVFNDKLPRQLQTYRRKSDDERFLVPIKMRFKGWKPYLPPALLGGQSLELLFQGMEIEATGERDFDRFPIPYRAVATDMSNGDAVVLSHGSLATAMRASMAVPGVFPPIELDGKPLADGGMAANFPIRIARELGADVVIGVDITSPLRAKEELGNLLTRLDQMTGLLTTRNRGEDMQAVRPGDVIMIPELGDISFSDFASAKDAIAAGEKAGKAQEARLRELSVSDAEWAAFQANHRRRLTSELVVDEIRIKNTGPLEDAIVEKRIDVPVGQPLDESRLAPQLLSLYSLDVFSPIHHDFTREDGKGVLTIETPPKPYGRNSLQFGLNLTDDFQGDTGFNLSLSHLMNPINRRGGEWRNIFQIGENEYIGTEYYQPIDTGLKWYFSPAFRIRRDKLRQYDEDGNAQAEYRIRATEGRLDGGRIFSNWGKLELTVFRTEEAARVKIGTGTLPEADAQDGGVSLGFHVDTLDTVTWPRSGVHADAVYKRSLTSFGSDFTGDTVHLATTAALTIGKNILVGSVEGGRTNTGPTNLGNQYLLGGFLRLSGLAQNQLIGAEGGLARVLYYRELTRFSLGALTQRVYAGLSLEAGNVYAPDDPVTWASLRRSGAIYAGADTIVGPVYLGFGYSEGGQKSVYLIIGQRF